LQFEEEKIKEKMEKEAEEQTEREKRDKKKQDTKNMRGISPYILLINFIDRITNVNKLKIKLQEQLVMKSGDSIKDAVHAAEAKDEFVKALEDEMG
jgi:hypothetical protein